MDEELEYVLTGWAVVFISLFGIIIAVLAGAIGMGIMWCLAMAVGFVILGWSFAKWRVPELINFVKDGGFKEWTRSLGL